MQREDLTLAVDLEGIDLYIHQSLVEHFEEHPLILTTRGPRLIIEKDRELMDLEKELLKDLEHKLNASS